MAELMSLRDGVAAVVRDGDSIALEGFTHLIPFAAGHEVLRQGRRDLEVIRMTPDILYDQMNRDGCRPQARVLIRRQPRRRVAAPLPRRDREWLAAPDRARGAQSRRDREPLRGWGGPAAVRGDARVRRHRPRQPHPCEADRCPFTGEDLVAVPALNPDAAIVHAQEADRRGNVQIWGIPGVQKEAVLAASRSLVTVERIVGSWNLVQPG